MFAASKGWSVDTSHTFFDSGISGAAVTKLAGRQRLLDAILSGRPPFQVLIVRDRSRFSRRDGEESFSELKQISRAGVQVWFIRMELGSNTAPSRLTWSGSFKESSPRSTAVR